MLSRRSSSRRTLTFHDGGTAEAAVAGAVFVDVFLVSATLLLALPATIQTVEVGGAHCRGREEGGGDKVGWFYFLHLLISLSLFLSQYFLIFTFFPSSSQPSDIFHPHPSLTLPIPSFTFTSPVI